MEIQRYICNKRELQSILLTYLENSNIDDLELFNFLEIQNFKENKKEFVYFLRLLSNISNNHHRDSTFIQKIKEILLYYETLIKQTLLNSEILTIFEGNKLILLFLIENNFIMINESNINDLIKSNTDKNKYCHFFYPEVKKFINPIIKKEIENELLRQDSTIFDSFNVKRQRGENDSYICGLIRDDDIESFVTYVNKVNYQLSTEIKHSIFETNSFLIDKKTSLIEYAAFFGSIQIFNYLRMNKVKMRSSLWLYVIHSKNADLIHSLEDNHIQPPDNSYETCLLESIKCHHNDFANYIKNNLLDPIMNNFYQSKLSKKRLILMKNVFECSFRYSNYSYFPFDFSIDDVFFNLCLYDYSTLVDIFIKNKRNELEANSI